MIAMGGDRPPTRAFSASSMNVTPSRVVICLALLGAVGCQTNRSAESRSQQFMERANYYQAYRVLVDEYGKETVDTDPRFRGVRVGYLLELGTEHVFNNHEYTAIETFEEVLAINPDDPRAKQWIEKAQEKLAGKAAQRGDEHERSGELLEALMAYDEALDHVANFPRALAGIESVAKTVKSRQERAEDHYTRGVAALGEQLYPETWYEMVNAVTLDPKMVKATQKRDVAHDHLLASRFQSAVDLEEAGYHAAALTEYQTIQQQDPTFEGINQRVEHMRREAKVDALVRDAEMAVLKRDFDKAREALDEAYETTITQKHRVVELQILVKEGYSEDLYQKARICQFENRKEDALALFKKIDEDWSGEGFKDVKTWISSLEAELAEARAGYERGQKAEQEGNLEAAIEAYDDALLYYPGFMGLDSKIAELKKKLEDPGSQPEQEGDPKGEQAAEAKGKQEPEPKGKQDGS